VLHKLKEPDVTENHSSTSKQSTQLPGLHHCFHSAGLSCDLPRPKSSGSMRQPSPVCMVGVGTLPAILCDSLQC